MPCDSIYVRIYDNKLIAHPLAAPAGQEATSAQVTGFLLRIDVLATSAPERYNVVVTQLTLNLDLLSACMGCQREHIIRIGQPDQIHARKE